MLRDDATEDTKNVLRKKQPHTGFVKDGFVYHLNSKKESSHIRYLACSEYKRLGCRARAVMPADGTSVDLIVKAEHNHPPMKFAEERMEFIKELKRFVQSVPTCPLKDAYKLIQNFHPEGASLSPFHKLLCSMRRWRNEPPINIQESTETFKAN